MLLILAAVLSAATVNTPLIAELRQERIKFLGPRSETLSDLQLELRPMKSQAKAACASSRKPDR